MREYEVCSYGWRWIGFQDRAGVVDAESRADRVATPVVKALTILKGSVSGAIAAVCVGVSLCGCAKERPVWSTQIPSPDGERRAVAETFVQNGPGANYGETIVHIERGSGREQYSSEVLAVADAGKSLGLSMKWLSPTRLLIVIKEDPRYLEYQVVKTLGVDIALRYDKH